MTGYRMRQSLTRPLCVLLILGACFVLDSETRADELAIVSMAGSGEVAFIDIDAAEVIGSVQLPDRASFPLGIAVTPDGSALAVACGMGYVSFIDSGGATTTTMLSGPTMSGITEIPNVFDSVTVTPDGTTALVTEVNESGQVFLFDMATKELVAPPCLVGDDPNGIVIVEDPNEPGTDVAYVVEGDRIHVLDWSDCSFTTTWTPGGIGEIGAFAVVPDEPRAILTDADNGVYLFDTTSWTLLDSEFIDPARFAETGDAAVSPDGTLAIGTNQADQSVTFIVVSDFELTIEETLEVGGIPRGVAFTQDGQTAVVALANTSQVVIIDVPTRQVTATITAGLGLVPVAVVVAEMASWTADGDGDTFIGALDCDEANPYVYPGAPELLDGVDNQCPGDAGHGQVDELMEVTDLLFIDSEPGGPHVLCWSQLSGVTGYEVARANDPLFADSCARQLQPPAACQDTDPLPPNEIRFYLVHAYGCFPDCIGGTWGQDPAGANRTVPCSQYPSP